MLPYLPHSPTPCRRPRYVADQFLLIEPASTISTISMVAGVVMQPGREFEWMPSRFSMVAICGPTVHHDRVDRGLLHSTMSRANALAVSSAHGVAAIFDDDGFIVILLHMRQRLGKDRA